MFVEAIQKHVLQFQQNANHAIGASAPGFHHHGETHAHLPFQAILNSTQRPAPPRQVADC